MNKRKVIILLIISLSFFMSCSFEDNQSNTSKPTIEHPDLILYNTTYSLKFDTSSPIILTAEKLEIDNKTSALEGSMISFTQKDEDNKIILKGSADSIYVNEENKIANLEGNVEINFLKEDFSITCDKLEWNNESQIMNSDDKNLTVAFKNNTIVGEGFSGNLSTRVFEFLSIKKGELNEE